MTKRLGTQGPSTFISNTKFVFANKTISTSQIGKRKYKTLLMSLKPKVKRKKSLGLLSLCLLE